MINCIAIDDEPLALRQMTDYIARTPFLHLVAACYSAIEAAEVISTQEVDLLFVDINMPDLNGLDFVRSLTAKPLVIFTTAYSEYALEGFRVDALDYLLKPIDYADFLRSAEKARRQYHLLETEREADLRTSEHIFVKSEYKTLQIDTDKITHIESRSEYVRIFAEGHKPVMTLGSLKSYEERLPGEMFMRIHRSYIVNLRKITAIRRNHVIIGKETEIPIGDIYRKRMGRYLREE